MAQALAEAVRREDFAAAARLKRQIDQESSRAAEAELVARDAEAAELVASASIEQMLESAGKDGIVVLHFTEDEYAIANSMVARTASRFASSQIAGGPACGFVQLCERGFERLGAAAPQPAPSQGAGLPPGWKAAFDKGSGREYYYNVETRETVWIKPLSEAAAAAAALRDERGVESLPTTQIWRGKQLVRQVASTQLEAALVALGARSTEGSTAKGNERYRDRNVGSGLPSADVDDIDFTGGVAGAGGTDLSKNKGRTRGVTSDYFPGLVDRPGDEEMGDDEGPSGPPTKGPDWSPNKWTPP